MANVPVAAVPAVHNWPSNGHLISAAYELGYVGGHVLDMTYGDGGFWTQVGLESRIHPIASITINRGEHDFRHIPEQDASFDTVVFDPPYKLNGTSRLDMDERYGVDVPARWQERHLLMAQGFLEGIRVLRKGGYLLVKCKDQVSSGAMRWQTDMLTDLAKAVEVTKVDRFDLTGHNIPQPEGRNQLHAQDRASQLLVFKKRWGA